MIARFWWGDGEKQRIHWLKWEELGRTKYEGGLGFRDLRAFNMAMLAKQAWRLLKHPNGLLGRIYCAKYYPGGDIFKAQSGNRPSHSWRSICSSLPLLKAGTRWRIGNGRKVNVWTDNWLPRTGCFRPFSPAYGLPRGAKVEDLIDREHGCWNRELVESNFLPCEAEEILSIPLGSAENEDILVWHFSRSGQFSVKSAYFAGLELRRRRLDFNRGSTSSVSMNDFGFIWKTKLPPKVKLFLWRLCRDLLPTKANLYYRHAAAAPWCDICVNEADTAMHIFFFCHYARQVWALSNIPLQSIYLETHITDVWVKKVRLHLDDSSFEFFVVCCWSIWYRHNNAIFGERELSPIDTVQFAQQFLLQYRNANTCNPTVPRPAVQRVWRPPDDDVVKINYDASLCTARRLIGVGILARNRNGECLKARSVPLNLWVRAEIAEVIAAKMACLLAKDMGWEKIVVEGDCAAVVQALNQAGIPLSDIGPLIADCKTAVSLVCSKNFSLVYRDANKAADLLARMSFSLADGLVQFADVLDQALSFD